MGSFPSTQTHHLAIASIVIPQLTPDSSAFEEKVKKMKFHNSVLELKRAADETRQQVSKALTSVKNNPYIFRSVKPKFESKSINVLNLPEQKNRRVITEIQQRKAIHSSIVVKKERVKCPQIKMVKQQDNRFERKNIKRFKINSALSFINPSK